MRFRDRADIVNAALINGYGGQRLRDWANAPTDSDRPCTIQPADTDEDTADRDTTISTWWMACGPDERLDEHSRVRWDGLLLEVDGKVSRWKRGDHVHHLELRLREVDDGAHDGDGEE